MTDSPTDLPAPLSSASVTAGPLPPSSCASHLDSEICSCNFSGESSPFLAWSWFLEAQWGNRWILKILLFSELSLQHTHTEVEHEKWVISFMYWEGRKPAHYMGSEDNLQESLSPSTIVMRREYSQPGLAASISLHNLSHQLYHISKSIIKIFKSTIFTILTGMCK